MPWLNRSSLQVLAQRFPSLREGGENGEQIGWCPLPHAGGVPVRFTAHQLPDGWAINFCDFGHLPSEIWEGSQEPRDPGADDDAKPGLERFACILTPEEIRKEPVPRQYLLRVAQTGAGILKSGEVFMLAAKGGSGKSNALMQLAVAVATGTTWFGAGRGWTAEQGRVLVVFAEEDRDEITRRLHFAAKAAGLVSDEALRDLAANLVLLPMRGESVALCGSLDKGIATVTNRCAEILSFLQGEAKRGRPFRLIAFDPLARFAGADVEKDNAAATKFVEICERFTGADCGSPNLGITHHTRKVSPTGEVDDLAESARGASALKDGFRWTAVMVPAKKDDHFAVKLTVSKSNHARKPEPLLLAYAADCEGMLQAVAPKAKETEAAKDLSERDLELENRLHDSIEKRGPDSGNALAARIGRRPQDVYRSLNQMVEAGRLEKRKGKFHQVESNGATEAPRNGGLPLFPVASGPEVGKS